MKIAVYPGSFDPITNGHLDILKRALNVFDKVIVLVANNPKKQTTFDVNERRNIIKNVTKDMKNVEVDSTEGLVVAYAKTVGATALVRGLRAVTDFEYELQMATTNEFVDSSIDMVFFMTHLENTFISSSSVKELFFQGLDISKLVPQEVIHALESKK
ncbi:MAG: pantetheine-phosphate adenylyltransferase [Erysipelotrichaceae bacterium]|nr:pantetheine-phosphate adenylyltransferase [Erysipelotrichaceae bacterium]